MFSEMKSGNTSPNGGLFISMRHLNQDLVKKQFRGMVERCADCGFDLAGGLVEVVPTAHYFMGGVVCGVDTSTELPGLFVAGEDAGGVHGANRLGGNGVANSTVFGAVAGDSMAAWVRNEALREPDRAAIDAAIAHCERPFKAGARGDLEPLREKLYDTMWEKAGIIRDAAGLESALDDLNSIETQLRTCSLGDSNRSFNLTWHDWLNLQSLTTVSRAIATAALARSDSRGAHFRSDFPDTGALESSSFTSITVDGRVSMKPVEFTRVRPGQSLLKNAA